MKEIPKRNYLWCLFLVVGTVLVVLYLGKWYQTSLTYREKTPILGTISEIKLEELDAYIVEHPTFFLYLSSSQNVEMQPYEEELKDLILEYELRDSILYLDQTSLEGTKKQTFIDAYFMDDLKSTAFSLPNLLYIENGKVKSFLKQKDTSFTKEETLTFFKTYGVVE